jgi:L-methionine (R)-S-oxide reductase
MQKKEAYREIEKRFSKIISEKPPWEAALVSLIALLKEQLPYVSWVGLYRLVEGTLWIGPYQGKVACAQIQVGRGVCGTAVARKRAIIVPNVEEFPGHIICDPESRSELVIPVEQHGKMLGVLDLDSHKHAAFEEIDLKEITALLERLDGLEV